MGIGGTLVVTHLSSINRLISVGSGGDGVQLLDRGTSVRRGEKMNVTVSRVVAQRYCNAQTAVQIDDVSPQINYLSSANAWTSDTRTGNLSLHIDFTPCEKMADPLRSHR